MAGNVLPSILQPGVVNETVSTLDVHNTLLQDFFGSRMNSGQRRMNHGRHFSWDIFDETREVATARVPGTPPARRPPQPVGNVTGTFPRVHEEIPLQYEEIHNLRVIGGPSNVIDIAGENYIAEQEQIIAQRFTNHREFQWLAMTRGMYFYSQVGDDLFVSLTGGDMKVDYQVPVCNKGRLDLVGGVDRLTDWGLNADVPIPEQIENVNADYEQITGMRVQHMWMNANTMRLLLNNSALQARAGTSNPIVDRREVNEDNSFTMRLRGLEWITMHVTDSGLDIPGANPTFNKLFPDNYVLFTPTPSTRWVQWYAGSEVVVEWVGRTPTERFDAYFYAEPVAKPAGYNLIGVMNGIPALKRPRALAIGYVGADPVPAELLVGAACPTL